LAKDEIFPAARKGRSWEKFHGRAGKTLNEFLTEKRVDFRFRFFRREAESRKGEPNSETDDEFK
jgi:hypothetical protein